MPLPLFRFVVIVTQGTKEQRNAITKYVQERKLGYWHWSSDVWLVSSYEHMQADQFFDQLRKVVPSPNEVQMVVLRVEVADAGVNWAVYGPKLWGEWLRQSWVPEAKNLRGPKGQLVPEGD